MLSLVIFLPVLVAVVLIAVPRIPDAAARWSWLVVALIELMLLIVMWAAFRPPESGSLAFEEQLDWIPNIGSSYHIGIDGLSLPLLLLTAVIFVACAIYALREQNRPKPQAALFLFLQTSCLGCSRPRTSSFSSSSSTSRSWACISSSPAGVTATLPARH